jgi:hypothetical protein
MITLTAKIYIGDEIVEIDYKHLISLNSKITYRSDNKLPSYGIMSNDGRIEFNDIYDTANGLWKFNNYAEEQMLTSDIKVEIVLKNTIAKTEQRVGLYETKDWDYDNDNKSVSVALKDDLEEWQDIFIDGISYDPREPYKVLKNGTMAELYDWLHRKTLEKYEMLSLSELDDKTRIVLENTKILYPLLESGSLWQQWEKLCQVCALYIYKNNQGKTVCTYTLGS